LKSFVSLYKFTKNIVNLRSFELISLQLGKVGSSSILKSYPKSYQVYGGCLAISDKYFSHENSSKFFTISRNRLVYGIATR
jgi:hypothetical protein